MRLKTPQRRTARIEIIPLIDIVFLLLVFFIYAMVSMTVHRSVKVDLPEAGVRDPELMRHVTVTIDSEGALYVEGEPVEINTLVPAVKEALDETVERKVVIDGDRSAHLGLGVQVLEKLSHIEEVRVGFSVKPSGNSRPQGSAPAGETGDEEE